MRRYHAAVQLLCTVVQPSPPKSDIRHPIYEEDKDPRLMEYRLVTEDRDLVTRQERCGVLHLVHCWIQQGQASKVSMTDLLKHLLSLLVRAFTCALT